MRSRLVLLLTALIVVFASGLSTSQELPSLFNNSKKYDLSHRNLEFTGSSLVAPNKIPEFSHSYSNKLKKGIFSLYSDRMLLYSFVAAGLFANTSIDERLRSSYYENVKSPRSNSISRIVKPFGNGNIMIPSYVIGFLLGKTFNNNSLEEWSKNTFNATLISVPGLLASQYSLGSSRPSMGKGSKWWLDLDRTNGASGHTLISAIPFITTAKMTGNKYLKILLYSASTFTGISRINDDAHYASQVLLGYAWAYCSVNSVFSRPEKDRDQGQITPQKKKSTTVSVNIGITGIGFSVSF